MAKRDITGCVLHVYGYVEESSWDGLLQIGKGIDGDYERISIGAGIHITPEPSGRRMKRNPTSAFAPHPGRQQFIVLRYSEGYLEDKPCPLSSVILVLYLQLSVGSDLVQQV